jgi:hypothetical protein
MTLTSMTNMSAWQSTAISNTTNLELDYMISGTLTTGAAASNGDSYVLLYGYDGTNYPWGGAAALGASSAAVTMTGRALAALAGLQYGQLVPGTGMVFGGVVPMTGVAAGTAVAMSPFSMSQAFQMGGLAVPVSFGVVVVNCQGQSSPSSSAGTMYYNGVKQTIA